MPRDRATHESATGGRDPKVLNSSHILTLLVFIYILVFATAWGQSRDLGAAAGREHGGVAKPGSDELVPVAVPEPSPKAMQYYRSGMWLWVLNRIWGLLVPGVIAFSGFSARLRNLARRLGKFWFFTIGVYIVLYLAIVFLIDLPLSYYQGFVRQHAYGLSNQTLGKWLHDALIGFSVESFACVLLLWIPYLLLAKSPRRWWVYTAILMVPFLFLTVFVKPIWIDPLFNSFGPMKNKELERSIQSLASRAGIEGSRVFEVDKSVDTNAVNAYVTGFWQTKRIVLWDTLIKKLEEPELLVVMGHEMGHYVLGHVVRSILLSSIVTLAGLFMIDRLGRWLVEAVSRPAGICRPCRHRLGTAHDHAVRARVSGLEPRRTRVQPSSRARGRPICPRADTDQSLRGSFIRQASRRESQQSASRPVLSDLSIEPPQHRRAH